MAELITATRPFPSSSADKAFVIPTRLEITGTLILRYGWDGRYRDSARTLRQSIEAIGASEISR